MPAKDSLPPFPPLLGAPPRIAEPDSCRFHTNRRGSSPPARWPCPRCRTPGRRFAGCLERPDIVVGLPRNRLDDFLIQGDVDSSQTSVSLHVLWRWRKGTWHESSILAKSPMQLKLSAPPISRPAAPCSLCAPPPETPAPESLPSAAAGRKLPGYCHPPERDFSHRASDDPHQSPT